MISRIPLVKYEQLSPTGRDIYASILSTRGNLDGPFLAWLHSPHLAAPAEKLGAFCRYNTSLAEVESELLISNLKSLIWMLFVKPCRAMDSSLRRSVRSDLPRAMHCPCIYHAPTSVVDIRTTSGLAS